MKVLVIAQRFPPDMSGSCTRAWNVVKGLEALGHEVTVIAAAPRDSWTNTKRSNKAFEYSQDGIRIFRVWLPELSYSNFMERLAMHLSYVLSSLFPLLSVGKFDVIWAANPNFFAMFPASIFSLIFRAPIVRNVDDLWPEAVFDLGYIKSSFLRKLLHFISKITYIIPKTITPISESYKKSIMRDYNIDGKKITVIEHGVDLNVFHPTPNNNSYGDGFVVMYSGKLGVAYDFDVILEAALKLSSFKRIIFVIRGFGEEANYIASKITECNLSNVILDTTFVDKYHLRELLNSAHVFIIPNKPIKAAEQGLPTKILEYQACGKPIICCSEGESSRYVSVTKSGLVVCPGDSEGLAKCILQLYRDERLVHNLGSNGWSNISMYLTLEKIGERILKIFEEVANPETLS